MSSANDAFAIEMSGGSVHDGKGGTIFSNIGGSLTINQVQFSNNNGMALISMSGAASGAVVTDTIITGGAFTVSSNGEILALQITYTHSNHFPLKDVFNIINGAGLVASGVEVSGTSVQGAVFSLDQSRGTIANTSISNIDMTGTSATWAGVNVTNGGSAHVTNTTFLKDKQMLAAMLAFGTGSSLNADRISFNNLEGSRGFSASLVASVYYLDANATGSLNLAQFDNVSQFTVRTKVADVRFLLLIFAH